MGSGCYHNNGRWNERLLKLRYMNNIILIIGSYIVTFLIGRLYGVCETKKIIDKILDKYK